MFLNVDNVGAEGLLVLLIVCGSGLAIEVEK